MITIPIWLALLAPFGTFLLGVALMAAFAVAGRADDDMEHAADHRMRVDVDALPQWQRDMLEGDE